MQSMILFYLFLHKNITFVGIHQKSQSELDEGLQLSTHNSWFYREVTKISFRYQKPTLYDFCLLYTVSLYAYRQ